MVAKNQFSGKGQGSALGKAVRFVGLPGLLSCAVEQARLFTFPGDEKQSEISQHSDSLNFFLRF